ncbi:MAG: peptidylprolyl isomerase [Desulfonatronovibrionaceae bacterium]
MPKLEDGTKIKVHYTGTLEDGTVFDSSREREPLEFTLGEGEVISGFENTVRDMDVGETRKVTISKDEAYGEHNKELVFEVPAENFPEDIPREEGQQILLRSPEGQEAPAFIVGVGEENITVDANHPLAGFDLNFELELIQAS